MKMDPKRPTPRQIIIKMTKVKDKARILKVAREKQLVTYKGVPIGCQLIPHQKYYRPEGNGMKYSKVMKSKDLSPKLLYPARLSFEIEGEIKSSDQKNRLKEFITTKSAL